MTKYKTTYICKECGWESPGWLGRCPQCQAWNSLLEQSAPSISGRLTPLSAQPEELSTVTTRAEERYPVPISELNRVLGGGLVPGSLVLVGGEPGIGKSTLLLQASSALIPLLQKVVYVSGEETAHQVSIRAQRLGISGEGLYFLAMTDLEGALERVEKLSPGLVVVDSIQTVFLPGLDASPGSVTQVRECALRLMQWAKEHQTPVFITGHVTKEGNIAGPKLLEHIVDVVLYFEGESLSNYRILRAAKNRFGSISEIGVFEMLPQGMIEVTNPSRVFLSESGEATIGSAVTPVLEGSRPLLVEIQALTNTTAFGQPRRTASGIDFGRLLVVIAVLSRRAGLKLGNQDIIVSAVGGIHLREPAIDLAMALAIASSFLDRPVIPALIGVGEVGLSGELRPVPQLERRLAEASRIGFKRCLIPTVSVKGCQLPEGMEAIPIANIKQAIQFGLVKQ